MKAPKQAPKTMTKILPENPGQAAHELIRISGSLIKIADRETQALVQNDLMSFAILQDEKELVAARYKKASEEFRSRLEDFKSLDAGTINQLDSIQRQLGEITQSNNKIVVQMQQRAHAKTQNMLVTAQELGQSKPVYFPDKQQERV